MRYVDDFSIGWNTGTLASCGSVDVYGHLPLDASLSKRFVFNKMNVNEDEDDLLLKMNIMVMDSDSEVGLRFIGHVNGDQIFDEWLYGEMDSGNKKHTTNNNHNNEKFKS